MTRISISLPDELTARLEPIKGKINVSQVCREALERRIAAFERAAEQQGEDLDLGDLIARFRDERALIEGKFETLARSNASSWLGTSSYLELKAVAENQNSSSMDKYRLPRAAFRRMKEDMGEAKLGSEGLHAVVYKTAWLDYVRGIWDEIVKQLEEQTDDAVDTTESGSTAETGQPQR